MALRLSASSQYLNKSSGLPSSTAWGLSLWYRRDGTGEGTYEWISALTSGSGPSALIWISGSIYAYGTGSIGPLVAPTNGVWYFLALSQSSTTLTGYVATVGATSLTSASGTGVSITPTNLRLGPSAEWPTEWSNCTLANVKVWNAAPSSAALLQEMRTVRPMNGGGLISWMPLLGNAADLSGGGNWTVGGSPTYVDGPPVGWGAVPLVVQPSAGGPTTVDGSASLPGIASLVATGRQEALGSVTLPSVASLVSAGTLPVEVYPHTGTAPWSSIWRPGRY